MTKGLNKPTHVNDIGDFREQVIDHYDKVVDYTQFRLNSDNQIVRVSEREFRDMGEYDEFMRERLVISVHEVTDPNAPTYAPVGVNGEQAWLPRGIPVKVPRYMVERLLRSRPNQIRTKNNPDPSADVGMLITNRVSFDYPITIHRDPHPKGPAWVRRVIAEGQRA